MEGTKYASAPSASINSNANFDPMDSDDSVQEIPLPVKPPPIVINLSPTPEDDSDRVFRCISRNDELKQPRREPEIIFIDFPETRYNSIPKDDVSALKVEKNGEQHSDTLSRESSSIEPLSSKSSGNESSSKKSASIRSSASESSESESSESESSLSEFTVNESSSESSTSEPERKKRRQSPSVMTNDLAVEQHRSELRFVRVNSAQRKFELEAMKADIQVRLMQRMMNAPSTSVTQNEVSYADVVGPDLHQNPASGMTFPSQGPCTWAPQSWNRQMQEQYLDPTVANRDVTLDDVRSRIPENSIWAVHPDDLYKNNPRSRYMSKMDHSRCFKCKESGHFAHSCPNPAKQIVCTNCGLQGHSDYNCPEAICLKCGKKGSYSRNTCSSCRGGRQYDYKCMLCGKCGHSLTRCKLYKAVQQVPTTSTSTASDMGLRGSGSENNNLRDYFPERGNVDNVETPSLREPNYGENIAIINRLNNTTAKPQTVLPLSAHYVAVGAGLRTSETEDNPQPNIPMTYQRPFPIQNTLQPLQALAYEMPHYSCTDTQDSIQPFLRLPYDISNPSASQRNPETEERPQPYPPMAYEIPNISNDQMTTRTQIGPPQNFRIPYESPISIFDSNSTTLQSEELVPFTDYIEMKTKTFHYLKDVLGQMYRDPPSDEEILADIKYVEQNLALFRITSLATVEEQNHFVRSVFNLSDFNFWCKIYM